MKPRDIELLSAYLDGQLSPSDVVRLEARLKTDPELASVMDDLRVTRSVLRKLPQRHAPRNFTLTRKMVGQNPPLPRAYPLFRYATAIATLLFVFSFGLNTVDRQLATMPAFGMGGGGSSSDAAQPFAAAEVPATEAPAAVAPAATEAPLMQAPMAPAPTQGSPEIANSSRTVETPAAKTGDVAPPAPVQAEQTVQSPAPLIAPTWQIGLAVIAVIGALLMFLMQSIAINRWRQK